MSCSARASLGKWSVLQVTITCAPTLIAAAWISLLKIAHPFLVNVLGPLGAVDSGLRQMNHDGAAESS